MRETLLPLCWPSRRNPADVGRAATARSLSCRSRPGDYSATLQDPNGRNVAHAGPPSLSLPGRRTSTTLPASAFCSRSAGDRGYKSWRAGSTATRNHRLVRRWRCTRSAVLALRGARTRQQTEGRARHPRARRTRAAGHWRGLWPPVHSSCFAVSHVTPGTGSSIVSRSVIC